MDTTLYCPQCGEPMTVATEHLNVALLCPHCQHVFTPNATTGRPATPPATQGPPPSLPYADQKPGKDKVVAGLLGIFLGGFGVHRFYLGYVGIGVLQIIVTLAGCVTCVPIGCVPVPLGPVWGLVEGILCLTGKMTDAQGRPLTG